MDLLAQVTQINKPETVQFRPKKAKTESTDDQNEPYKIVENLEIQ